MLLQWMLIIDGGLSLWIVSREGSLWGSWLRVNSLAFSDRVRLNVTHSIGVPVSVPRITCQTPKNCHKVGGVKKLKPGRHVRRFRESAGRLIKILSLGSYRNPPLLRLPGNFRFEIEMPSQMRLSEQWGKMKLQFLHDDSPSLRLNPILMLVSKIKFSD